MTKYLIAALVLLAALGCDAQRICDLLNEHEAR